jgi:hypothetical protein
MVRLCETSSDADAFTVYSTFSSKYQPIWSSSRSIAMSIFSGVS